MARICHTNNCPVGVASQREELRARFPGVPGDLVNSFLYVAEEVRGILAQLGYAKLDDIIGKKFSADFELLFRLLKLFLFLGFVITIGTLFSAFHLTVGDLFASIVAFMPTCWALLQIAQTCRPVVVKIGFWDSIRALARGYEYVKD